MDPIEIFSWNENFATGIPEIDQQHRTLIGLINQLVSHLAYRSDAPTLKAIFDQLTAYAARHFQFEEAIWRQYLPEDPWETSPIQAHAGFVDEVNRLMAQADITNYDTVIEEIVAFLTRWLTFHILESDRRLAKVARALPSSIANLEATLARDFSHARILLAEDNPINREITRERLEKAGLRVDLADNGIEAVARARMARVASRPLMGGIWRSIRIRS